MLAHCTEDIMQIGIDAQEIFSKCFSCPSKKTNANQRMRDESCGQSKACWDTLSKRKTHHCPFYLWPLGEKKKKMIMLSESFFFLLRGDYITLNVLLWSARLLVLSRDQRPWGCLQQATLSLVSNDPEDPSCMTFLWKLTPWSEAYDKFQWESHSAEP